MQKITSAYANKMLRSLEFRKVLPMVETMTNTGVPSVRQSLLGEADRADGMVKSVY